jgi:Family of unknown function (DUF6314)
VARRVFSILAGRWQFDRIVPGVASLLGQASFAPVGRTPSSLRYKEQGDLRLDAGSTYAAACRYLYCLLGARIVIEFADGANRGAVLHDLSFAASRIDARVLVAHHRHSCWPDNYELAMRIAGSDRFETHYRIAGPRKNYEMHTVYERERGDTRT